MRALGYSASGNTASDDDGLGTVLTNLYDSTDRLGEVKNGAATVAAYLHNAQGQRVAKTVGGVTTHYLYDLAGNPIAEADGGTGAVSAEYVWLGGMPLAFIQGGAIYFVHPDHLGTPQRVTDAVAAVVWDADYRPFGEATVTGALTFNPRFPGQYYDAETGLHYNYFRDYDPTTGRYIQSDPIGLGGGWNSYGYVGGNPVMWVDPRGLQWLPECFVLGDCLLQAKYNLNTCLDSTNSATPSQVLCAARIKACDAFKKNKKAYALCMASAAVTCLAGAVEWAFEKKLCYNEEGIQRRTCARGGGITGYVYQINYEYIPGCGCFSEPDYLKKDKGNRYGRGPS